jgi:hypothetical protein
MSSAFDEMILTNLRGKLQNLSADEILRALIKDVGLSDVLFLLDEFVKETDNSKTIILAEIEYPNMS